MPVLDERGAMAGYRGSDRDITARMETEEKLREQAMLLENAVEATLLTDVEGRVRFWNRGAADLYEWTAHEAMGRDIAELFPGSPEKTYEARKRVLQGGSWTGIIHQRSRSGRDIVVQSRWSPVRGDDGRVRSILILNSDVTEAQRLEARLLRSQRMEGIGTLAGGIAHDLNNVLAPILMAIEVLGRKVTDPHGQRMLSILDTSARRGADLVKQVLTFARGASGPAGLLDPAHIIREMERMARETFPKSIEVRAEVPRDLWQVLGQATPLQQVLMNLCVNARDAMPAGGTLTLRAWNAPAAGAEAGDASEPKPHVVVEVADTGTGIAPEVVDRIFDPFFTTKAMGEGTGLGLSTTAAIVKSHEGFIDVETTPGRGTAFKVFLPAHAAAAARRRPPRARDARRARPAHPRHRRRARDPQHRPRDPRGLRLLRHHRGLRGSGLAHLPGAQQGRPAGGDRHVDAGPGRRGDDPGLACDRPRGVDRGHQRAAPGRARDAAHPGLPPQALLRPHPPGDGPGHHRRALAGLLSGPWRGLPVWPARRVP